MIDTSLFPYETFPVRLEVKEENKIAWFKDDYDLQKHIARYKLDKRKISIIYRDGDPTKPDKKRKNNIQQRTRKTSSGSASGSTRSTKKLDSSGSSSSTRKSKSATSKPKKKPKSK